MGCVFAVFYAGNDDGHYVGSAVIDSSVVALCYENESLMDIAAQWYNARYP